MTIEADLWVLPQSAVARVIASAAPRKRLFGGEEDHFYKVLRASGKSIAYFEWWGYAMLMCLQYLHDKKAIDLLRFMESPTADAIHEARGTVCVAVDEAEAREIRSALFEIEVDPAALGDFYNDFNEEQNADAGKAMMAALDAIRRWIEQIKQGSVGLILMG